MKLYKKDKKIINVIVLFIVISILVYAIKRYFAPFLWIVVLLILNNPIYKAVKFTKWNNRVCSAITIGFFNIALALILYNLGSSIYEVVEKLYIDNLESINVFIEEISIFVESIIGKIDLQNKMMSAISITSIKDGVMITGDGFLSYIIGNVACFFLMSDSEEFIGFLEKIVPEKFYKRAIKEKENIKSIIYIQIIIVLTSCLMIMIGFLILRIPHTVILSVICGILDLIPYVGTIIVFIPIIIYNIIVKEYIVVVGLICLYILVQIVREILEAKLLSDKFNLHPLVIFISVYIGIKVFGVIGAIIGPIYCMMSRDILFEE